MLPLTELTELSKMTLPPGPRLKILEELQRKELKDTQLVMCSTEAWLHLRVLAHIEAVPDVQWYPSLVPFTLLLLSSKHNIQMSLQNYWGLSWSKTFTHF